MHIHTKVGYEREMGAEEDPMAPVNHVTSTKHAALRARTLLSPVLRQLQEAALACGEPKLQARLLRAAEQVAETANLLFELEHGNKNTFDNLAGAVRARDHLRAGLSALQAPEMVGTFPPECADVVASALAIVFSAAKGGDWKDRESLRRARKRARMMEVPPSNDSRPASASAPETVPPIPLSRRVSKGPESSPPSRQPPPSAVPPSSRAPSSRNLYPQSERPPDSRRWNRRLTGRSVLEVDVGMVSESQFYAGLSLDLSTGGLFVATYQTKPVGSRVAVSLVLPNGHAIWAKGTVRWVREPRGDDTAPGMGVEFTEIEAEDLAAIKRFCEMRAPMYYDAGDEEKG